MTSRTPSTVGYVGFASLPNQVHRRMKKKGFELTLMLVGESGLGKSTLVSSLFLLDNLYSDRRNTEKSSDGIDIVPTEVMIEEGNIKLKLTIVDTPGFGDSLTGTEQYEPISEYIDNQFQKYLDNETGLNRRNITDTRVHCCFYFISPHSNGLKPIDIEFMKNLHHKVNIVPLIAKADTLTPQEIKMKKQLIMDDISKNQIKIYQLPDGDEEEDNSYKKQLDQLKKSIPFAIVGSTETFEIQGKKIRGRLYPWGVVEIENPKHSEFNLLRQMLISHMQDLQEVTHDLHYEAYRAQVLTSSGHNDGTKSVTSMASNMGQQQNYEVVNPTLAEKEAEIQRLREMMAKMQAEVQQQSQQQSVQPSPGSSGQRRKGPPPPPRKPDNYNRTNLDV